MSEVKDDTKASVEPVEKVEPKQEVQELSPVESQALEQGWVPKEDWVAAGNDPNDWRPAKEFVDRGELFKTIHTTRRELKQAQAALTSLQRHQQNLIEKTYQKAIQDLKMERRTAVRNDDLERVEEIEDQIDEIEQQKDKERMQIAQEAAAAAQSNAGVVEFNRWAERNQWYQTDAEMQEFADVTGIVYAKKNPGADPMYVLKYIEDKVRKQFPDKFGVRRAAPNPTASVDRTARSSTKAKDDVELDDNERIIMEDLVRNKVMTEAQYKAEIKKVRGK